MYKKAGCTCKVVVMHVQIETCFFFVVLVAVAVVVAKAPLYL